MLTVREVANELKVSTGIIYREISRRRLSHYRIGGAIRISCEQLQAYLQLAENAIKAAPSTFRHVKKIGG